MSAPLDVQEHTEWSWPRVMREARRFGIESVRSEQRALIEAVLAGRDAIGVLPDGPDASLCWQLPALLLPKPIVIVAAQQRVHRPLGTGIAPLLSVTAERLSTDDCIALLRRNGAARLVVDEAHCVSDRGHDFRPAYRAIVEGAKRLGRPPILALTSAATANTVAHLRARLGLREPIVVRQELVRRHVRFVVTRTVDDAHKRAALRRILADHAGQGIVYVPSRAIAEQVQGFLACEDIAAGLHHGKRPTRERETTDTRFRDHELRILIAYDGFAGKVASTGFVVHWTAPASLESYLAQTQLAGGDGQHATAHLFYRPADQRTDRVARYARSVECRAVHLARYFGDAGEPCGMCDVCARGSGS